MKTLAYDSGYHVMFCQSNETYDREVKAVETLLSSRVDGILVSVSKVTRDFEHFRKIRMTGSRLFSLTESVMRLKLTGLLSMMKQEHMKR